MELITCCRYGMKTKAEESGCSTLEHIMHKFGSTRNKHSRVKLWIPHSNSQASTQCICNAMQSSTKREKRAQILLPSWTSGWPHLIWNYLGFRRQIEKNMILAFSRKHENHWCNLGSRVPQYTEVPPVCANTHTNLGMRALVVLPIYTYIYIYI